MTTTAKPLPPHGSQARYKGSSTRPPCRCRRCITGWTQAGQRRHLLRLAGKPASLTRDEVTAVVAHINTCLDSGMSQSLIGRRADVAQSTISRLLTRPNAGCLRAQGERILAVHPGDFDEVSDRPSLGTVRRIRGLYYAGHGPQAIVVYASVTLTIITEIAGAEYEWVTPGTESAIKRACTALTGIEGTSRRARARALREGWAPLAAWDDDTIDDPAATPEFGDVLNFHERAALRREEIIHLAWCGHQPEQIVDRLNGEVAISTVRQIVQEWRTGQKRDRKQVAA
ncbi:hypothetical protein ACFY0F_23765 [Streptomyces sp. NPDC001544]|uniref:hypothetical protein n=1 Tax=Streptomyces sp. NPDC001544 TaxID=3364584 RepID=UPI0036C1E2FF